MKVNALSGVIAPPAPSVAAALPAASIAAPTAATPSAPPVNAPRPMVPQNMPYSGMAPNTGAVLGLLGAAQPYKYNYWDEWIDKYLQRHSRRSSSRN